MTDASADWLLQHDHDIVHRDVKPENLIFRTNDQDSDLVIVDFGISRHLNTPNEVLQGLAGSPGYAAPEILNRLGHGKPCDIWFVQLCPHSLTLKLDVPTV